MKIFLMITFANLILFSDLFAEERLKFGQIFTEIPSTSKRSLKKSFSKESLPYWGLTVGSTALLYHYDEEIYSDLQKRGNDWGIGNQDNTKSVLTISGQEILRLPTDTGSFMYFLGDGWMHAGIGGGFIATGSLKENNYTFNTGMMIWHGMVVSTIFNQALKRSFGRESPEVSTSKRGSWNLFPNINEYNSKTATYDAMPSGHIMTATLTFTIISERYPEYKTPLYSLYAIWGGALMFEMVNNGVHWASDYPLGIAMGYVFGKQALQMGKESKNQDTETSWKLMPTHNGVIAFKEF
jgi:membrane-associated phospholipid phosphatase